MRRVSILGVVVLVCTLLASGSLMLPEVSPAGYTATSPDALEPTVTGSPTANGQFGPRVEVVASGLEIPWAMAFAPDGRLFFTERPGRVRVIVNGQLLPDAVATLPAAAATGNENGLMGLAIDSDFADNGYIYVAYSYKNAKSQLKNRVSRLTVQGNQAGDEKVLLDEIPGEQIHDGGRLKIGPDGLLYISMGDGSEPGRAQDMNTVSGKVLRINTDGSIPDDNPFPGSPIFTLGHRNPQGLAFQPGTGRLFETEHGTAANDEVNVLQAGRNYGWPLVQGVAKDSRFVDPIIYFTPTIAPSGATFYDGDQLAPWRGNLFFATLVGQHLHRVVLGGADGQQVISDERLFEKQYGRLRDVIEGPDGFLYFCTNNRDGRGTPSPDDDRILRIVP
ncbi:MAG TPA: PQQ-dependent sugar dehydrogenase [Chloroflexota bacterium]|nr:PQQ-dependent sugar dehydrogenase [Chloroflexota bacterium]